MNFVLKQQLFLALLLLYCSVTFNIILIKIRQKNIAVRQMRFSNKTKQVLKPNQVLKCNQVLNKQNINFLNDFKFYSAFDDKATHLNQNKNYSNNMKSSIQYESCFNDDQRKATHYIIDNDCQVFKYCQKCAIILASRGVNIQKLSSLQENNQYTKNSVYTTLNINSVSDSNSNNLKKLRRSKVKSYVSRQNERKHIVTKLRQQIWKGQQQLDKKLQQLRQQLLNSQSNYSQLIQQVGNYFKQIEQTIQYQKYLAYNKILNHRVQNQENTRQFKQCIQQTIQQLKQINNDMYCNQDVIQSIGEEQFLRIIRQYRNRLGSVTELLDTQTRISHNHRFQIPQIPNNLYEISEYIIIDAQNEDNQIMNYHPVFIKSTQMNNKQKLQINPQQKYPNIRHESYSKNNNQYQQSNHKNHSINKNKPIQRKLFNSNDGQLFSLQNSNIRQSSKQSINQVIQPKQILLKQSFCIDSSINNSESVNRNQISFQSGFNQESSVFYKQNQCFISGEHHNLSQLKQQTSDNVFVKSYKSENILLNYENDQSLKEYLMGDSLSLSINNNTNQNTIVENNQTMLLNNH